VHFLAITDSDWSVIFRHSIHMNKEGGRRGRGRGERAGGGGGRRRRGAGG